MTSPFDPSAQFEDERGKTRTQIDREDLARELTGGSSKTNRFFGESSGRNDRKEEKRKRETERVLNALAQRLLDPEYAAAFQATNDAIARAQEALDVALEENARHIEELEERAVNLPDGRAVFLRADGKGETADGQIIPAEILLTLNIPNDATTIEEYDRARERRRQLGGYGDDIDTARTKVNDPDNPPSQEELEEIEREMKRKLAEINETPTLCSSFNPVAECEATAKPLDFSDAPLLKR